MKIAADGLRFISEERNRALKEMQEKIRIIERQREAILKLSTPVIQVWDDILIVPLIGTIDALRAQQTLKNLLDSIARTQSSVGIIDITGVLEVDTSVANHFLTIIDAARTLGAEVIITGASPDNAQTLAKLGVDLSKVVTKSSLKAGLESAFQMTEQFVGKRE